MFNKCKFWLRSVDFLGFIFSCKGIEVDPKKMDAVKSCPRPLTPSHIRSFFNWVGCYRRFIEGFTSIASPLTTLTQMKAKFIWSILCRKSFQYLKDRHTSTSMLNLLEWIDSFVVYYHTSRICLGYVFMKNGKVIVYDQGNLKSMRKVIQLMALN